MLVIFQKLQLSSDWHIQSPDVHLEEKIRSADQTWFFEESGRQIRLGRNLEAVKDKAASKSSNKKRKTEDEVTKWIATHTIPRLFGFLVLWRIAELSYSCWKEIIKSQVGSYKYIYIYTFLLICCEWKDVAKKRQWPLRVLGTWNVPVANPQRQCGISRSFWWWNCARYLHVILEGRTTA